jgi:CRP/FNR family transcriptional regulator
MANRQGERPPAVLWPDLDATQDAAWAGSKAPVPFRSRIGEHLWHELIGDAPTVYTEAGGLLCRSGSRPSVSAIISGLVRVFTWGRGGRQVPLRYARPGDLVGLAALLAETEILSAETVVDTVHVPVRLERLKAMTVRHPELGWMMAEQVATWGTASVLSLVGAASEQMRARVGRHLLDLAIPAGGGRAVAYVTHRSLADAVGTVREVVTRVLGELREQGLVETRAGRVIVLEPDRLARAVDDETAALSDTGTSDVTGVELAGLGTDAPA